MPSRRFQVPNDTILDKLYSSLTAPKPLSWEFRTLSTSLSAVVQHIGRIRFVQGKRHSTPPPDLHPMAAVDTSADGIRIREMSHLRDRPLWSRSGCRRRQRFHAPAAVSGMNLCL